MTPPRLVSLDVFRGLTMIWMFSNGFGLHFFKDHPALGSLERQFTRIAGVTEMTSASTIGGTNITLQFELQRDIDGAARDSLEIEEMGFPVFCVGTNPNGPTKNCPGRIGHPVTVGGVTVHAGDFVIGDADGVVVVPRRVAVRVGQIAYQELADDIRGRRELYQRLGRESELDDLVRNSPDRLADRVRRLRRPRLPRRGGREADGVRSRMEEGVLDREEASRARKDAVPPRSVPARGDLALDLPTLAWFDEFLRRSSRAIVLISHDRDFLNRQISRVLSLEVEGVRDYPGNYEDYKRQRAAEVDQPARDEHRRFQARHFSRRR